MDETTQLKAQIDQLASKINMLHERLEIVEQSQAAQNNSQLIKLSNEIANIKLAIYEFRTKPTDN